MRTWLPLLSLALLACSSTSTNPSGGTGGGSGAATGGASSGGAPSGGSAGAVSLDASNDGSALTCDEGKANCDTNADCETAIHCYDCNWLGADCLNAYKACLLDNSCKCQFACLHECAKMQGTDAAGVVDSCKQGCGSELLATKVLGCAVTDQLKCCFDL